MSTRNRNEAQSLVKPDDPDRLNRRAYADITSASAALDVTDGTLGHPTGHHDNLHVTIELPEASSSIGWTLYTWSAAAELWRAHPTIGTITVTDAQSPDASEIGIAGIDRVHFQFSDPVNMGDGANLWLEGSSF